MPENDIPEKRGFVRTPVDTALGFRIAGKNDFYSGRCIDLSRSGILLETETVIAGDDELSIIVNLADAGFSPLKVRVRIVRVDLVEGGSYRAAGNIISME